MTEICPDCGKDMKRRSGKTGDFWGCTGYPDCKKTLNISNAKRPTSRPKSDNQVIVNQVCFKGIMENWDYFKELSAAQIEKFYNAWAYRLMQTPEAPKSTKYPETMEDEEPPDYEE